MLSVFSCHRCNILAIIYVKLQIIFFFFVIKYASRVWCYNINLKGIGLDFPSIDDIGSKTYPNHNHVLRNGLIIIENLTNLGALADEPFQFAAFPLKIREGDGSTVRAVAFVVPVKK